MHISVHINKETAFCMQVRQQFFDNNANAYMSEWLRHSIEDLSSFMGKQEKEIINMDQRNYY